MENSENYSCVYCILHDQCESDVLCDFFDSGRSGESLTDDEIESGIELNRQEYKKAYAEYEMLEPEFEEESEMEGLDDLS